MDNVTEAADQSAHSDASKTASVSAASTPSTATTDPSPRRLIGELLDIGDEVLQERGEANGVMVLAVAYPLVLHRLWAEIAKTTAPEELIHALHRNFFGFVVWEMSDEEPSNSHRHCLYLHVFPDCPSGGSLEFPHCHKRNWASLNLTGTYKHIVYTLRDPITGAPMTPDVSIAPECPTQHLTLFEHKVEGGIDKRGPVRLDAVQEFIYQPGTLQYIRKDVPHRLDEYAGTLSLNVRENGGNIINTLFTVLHGKPIPKGAKANEPLAGVSEVIDVLRRVEEQLASTQEGRIRAFTAMGGDPLRVGDTVPIQAAFLYATHVVSRFHDRYPLAVPLCPSSDAVQVGVVDEAALRMLVDGRQRVVPAARVPQQV
ncbi:unnamed protein product [Vitrella brassicaformis CCMP3155]|uniref:Uncharacterized protein n=2 Tax=Vitrella brassicaformis TaxID=1169539 RepID=A0A0G4ETI9_VITBC|nr:unnamed protein product [Vitrella brassicaformis CCMP3155]|mmetsp:Transcript_1956/g.4280  ORF Transcript_1956/g.4280 Transcript_1956/m.4280 type:complete len:371 (+) Transcript_1956:118-1230(+)|eukprot:CEM00974.1 unnamed protein product [Vitrella brassicaformis CCMP3155]